MKYKLIIDKEKCVGCGVCLTVCPIISYENLEIASGKGKEYIEKMSYSNGTVEVVEEFCTGCGTCIKNCGFNAIKIEIFKEKFHKRERFDEKRLFGYKKEIYELIKSSEKPLSIEEISSKLNLSTLIVTNYLNSLKDAGLIFEHKINESLHFWHKPMEIKKVEKKAVEIKIDSEKAKQLEEKLVNAIRKISTVKSKYLIEREEIDKLLEEFK